MSFFNQQLRGMLSEDTRLVDCRNYAGETPLMRSMYTGESAVVKVNSIFQSCLSL